VLAGTNEIVPFEDAFILLEIEKLIPSEAESLVLAKFNLPKHIEF
jgi:hypothetical protein